MPEITLRVRTKDGVERLKVDAASTLAGLHEVVSAQLGVPRNEQVQLPNTPCTQPPTHLTLAARIPRV